MTCIHLISIKKSSKKEKKLMATFYNCETNREKTIHFGNSDYSDYTIHKDPERKYRYLTRHSTHEDWNNPMTAGSLSRYILWNKTSIKASISDFKKRFKL